MPSDDDFPALHTLIEGCKRGDPNAWSDFDRQVRPGLEIALGKRLGHFVDTATWPSMYWRRYGKTT
jgi:hypothetical protein